jgi:hypothetical protein
MATAPWFQRSPVLGLAQCRRTFCHHLILEFLCVHPAVAGRLEPRVSGLGLGLLYGVAEIAGRLEIDLIWGEATARSAPFYSKVLGIPDIKDCFIIEGKTMARCRRDFREKLFGGLEET